MKERETFSNCGSGTGVENRQLLTAILPSMENGPGGIGDLNEGKAEKNSM